MADSQNAAHFENRVDEAQRKLDETKTELEVMQKNVIEMRNLRDVDP